jgi:hypothetical protein
LEIGVTTWQMLTGRTPFRGTAAEVMHQHQQAPLPLEQLDGVPQPLVVMLELLLEKDPTQRFQAPAELLKAMPTITSAIQKRGTVTRQGLRKPPLGDSYTRTRNSPARRGPKKMSVARLPVTGSEIFGREEDVAFLEATWANHRINIVTIVAWAGVGKSTLVNHWLARMAAERFRSAELVFCWSFTGKAVAVLRQRTNSLMRLLVGLATRIQGSEQHGKRVKGWRNSSRIVEPCWFSTGLSATLQLAKRVYSLAQEQSYPALIIGACRAFTFTLTFLGDFEMAREYATRGVTICRSGVVESPIEEINAPALSCLIFEAFCGWHMGEIDSCHATFAEAISIAKERNDMHGLAVALLLASLLAQLEANPARTEGLAAQLIEVSMRQNFDAWLACGTILRGWARTVSNYTAEGISWIEDGIRDYRTTGSALGVPYCLAIKAQALCLAGRTSEALETIGEAQALIEMNEERWCSAELYRLRGVFLAALGAAQAEIEGSFRATMGIAKEQKSISLANRVEASYAEYRARAS